MECLATGPFPVPPELPQMTTSWCGAVRPGTASLHPDPPPRKPTEAETLDRGFPGQVAVPLSQSADPRLLLSEQGLGLLPSWQAPPRDPCPPPLSPPWWLELPAPGSPGTHMAPHGSDLRDLVSQAFPT